METISLDHIYQQAYDAHRNTSFDPEKRAKQFIAEYTQELNEDLKRIGSHDQKYIQKYTSHLLGYLSSRSGCASTMITGPSNFNVRRNEKANKAADNKFKAFVEWRERVLSAIERDKKKNRSDSEINNEIWNYAFKKINDSADVIIRFDKGIDTTWSRPLFVSSICNTVKTIAKSGNTEVLKKCLDLIRELNSKGPKSIIRENNAIFQLEQVAEGAREAKVDIQSKESKEYSFSGGLMILNYQEDRVQIKHDSKPLQDVITDLKKNSFKWSGKHQVWQRQLTNAGIYAACQVTGININIINS